METNKLNQVDPSKIMQVGMGFWASKTLLTATNLGLFTLLAEAPSSGQDIKENLNLQERSLYDFLDTLVALGFLNRTGLKETAVYSNAEDSDFFLDKNKPSYVGGMLEMANNRLYPFWNDLEEGLKTGLPQNETKTGGAPIFEALYADAHKLKEFLKAMGGVQMGNFIAFSKGFDFSGYKTLCDIGGAGAYLSIQVALNNAHMTCVSFDLPPVESVAKENVCSFGLDDRISIQSDNFFEEDFPKADIITMGNILHDWGIDNKKILLKKAFDSLPAGGALVVIENIIDDNRELNVFGLLMSLNMLIETDKGFDFSFSDFNLWASETGFKRCYKMPLTGPSSAVVAIKG